MHQIRSSATKQLSGLFDCVYYYVNCLQKKINKNSCLVMVFLLIEVALLFLF